MSKVVKGGQIVLGPAAEAGRSRGAQTRAREEIAAAAGAGDARYSLLEGARAQARRILEEARRAAAQLYEQARRAGAEEGRAAGFRRGADEGRKQAAQEEEAAVRQLRELLGRCEARRQELERQSCEQSLDFAFSLAEKILGIEIDRKDEAFLGLCRGAAARMGECGAATLRVGPRGYAVAQEHEAELKKMLAGLTELHLEKSEADPGACILEAPQGSVDAGAASQLARARTLAGG